MYFLDASGWFPVNSLFCNKCIEIHRAESNEEIEKSEPSTTDEKPLTVKKIMRKEYRDNREHNIQPLEVTQVFRVIILVICRI